MKRNLIYCLILYLAVIGLWGCATTARTQQQTTEPQERTTITGIEIKDNMVIIRADNPFIYTIYRPGDPYKLIVDIPDTSIGGLSSRILSKSAGVTEIIPSQIESPSLITRLEIILQTPAVVEQEYKNNTLTLALKEQAPQEMPVGLFTDKEATLESAQPEQKPLPKATDITRISFQQKVETVNLVIKGNGSMIPNIFPLDDRIVIDVPDVAMHAAIPLEVVSPVTGIRSDQQENKVRIVVDMKEQTNFDVTAIGDSIVIAFQRPEGERPAVSSLSAMRSEDSEKTFKAETEAEGEKPLAALEEGDLAHRVNANIQGKRYPLIFRMRISSLYSGCSLISAGTI